jgi:DNA-binding GntR family transcriptional regulator
MHTNLLELITIDRRSTVSFDVQVKVSIKQLILDQSFYYQTKMPSTLELAEFLNVEEALIKKAYNDLVLERYLKTDNQVDYSVSFFELTHYFFDRNTTVYDAIISLGLTPSIECVEKTVVELDRKTIEKIGFNPEYGNKYFYINRIYKGNNQPIMVLENYLPLYIFPDIDSNFKGDEPLNAYIDEHYNLIAKVSVRKTKSVNLTQELADFLKERKNAASIQSTNHIYDKYDRLIDFGRSHTVSSYYFQAFIPKEEMKKFFPEMF